MKKHLLFLFAALLPLLASAKVEIEGIWYNLNAEAKTAEVTWPDGTEYSGDVTIPSIITYGGVEYRVTEIGYSAFFLCTSLTSVTLPESVMSIGECAFDNCDNLTTITIPENMQLTNIGDYSFRNCFALIAITIPKSVVDIGESAFESCSSLTSITFHENSKLNSIGNEAFISCKNLTSITIPKSVTSIGRYAFSHCSSLTSIIVDESNMVYDSRNNCNAIIEKSSNALIQGCSATIIPEDVTSIASCALSPSLKA